MSVGTGSPESWSQITKSSLTTTPSEIFAHSWESRTTTPPPPTQKSTGKLKSQTDPCLKSSRLSLRGQRVWPEELSSVLWAYRTTTRTPTGETPFRLAYGSEAIILAKVRLTSYRVGNHDERKNNEAMHLQLDLLEEVRTTAEQRLAQYQDLMAKYYNS